MKDRFQQFWKQSAPRERWLMGGGLALLFSALLYFYVWQPVNQGRHKLRASLPQLRANAQQMHSDAAEASRLKTLPAVAALPPGGLRGAVEQLAASYKLPLAQLSAEGGERISLTMASVSFDNWVRWLGQLQTQYQIRLESSQIEALPQAGMVKVQAVLAGKTAG